MITAHAITGRPIVPLWKVLLFPALAGALGWGIRGQYGHETGAMIAGLLVSLTLMLLFCPSAPTLSVARAVAWGTIAMGFGGSMTYGQTIGLTQDAPLVGNWAALFWGMLGLALKGSLWIGFAGIFLGMGLGGTRYRTREILLLMGALLVASVLGIWILNHPFHPANKGLPTIHFSDSWHWEPGASLKPRPEVWGGLLFAIVALLAYTHFRRRDPMASRLGLWGMLGGAIGFPLGQSLQSFHAWNHEIFASGLLLSIDPFINWWNFMETTFGLVMGAVLGLGLWLNRERINLPPADSSHDLRPSVEWALLSIHLTLLIMVEFFSVPIVDALYDFGLALGLVPIVAVTAGRFWPYLLILPVTLLPIAGKTFRKLVSEDHTLPFLAGLILYLAVPLTLAIIVAMLMVRTPPERPAGRFQQRTLLLATWLYFSLNYAFFHFPWPWSSWTQRTPNALVFILCALGLTFLCLTSARATATVVDARKNRVSTITTQ